VIRHFWRFRQIDSTNSFGLQLSQIYPAQSYLIWTNQQTQGRGRQARVWHAPAGSICASLVFTCQVNEVSNPQVLNLLAALAVCELLEAKSKAKISIKWPNDVYLKGKKLGGILSEAKWKGNIARIVIGIGLNLNVSEFPPGLSEQAVSWLLVTGQKYEELIFLRKLAKYFEDMFVASQAEGIQILLARMRAKCHTLDSHIIHLDKNKELTYKAVDIAEDGSLVVLTQNKQRINLYDS